MSRFYNPGEQPHTTWRCDLCGFENSCLDGDCQNPDCCGPDEPIDVEE